MLDRIISASQVAQTPADFNDAVEGLSDDLYKTKSDTYLTSEALLSDKSGYKDNITKVEEQFSINLTTPPDEDVDSDAKSDAKAAEDAKAEAKRVEDARLEAERLQREEAERVAQERADAEREEAANAEKVALQRQQTLEQLNIESDGALNDLSEEDQQAVFEASQQLPGSQRDNLIAAIQTGDSDKLNQFIADPSTPIDTSTEAIDDSEDVVEEGVGLNDIEQAALDHLKSISTGGVIDNLSPELQRDVAQAAVAIQRTTTQQLDAAQKKAEEDNTDLTANQIE